MPELLQEYWMLVVAALVIAVLLIWWLFLASRRTTVELEITPEEGGAKRNQALIDAPPVAAKDIAANPVSAAQESEPIPATPAATASRDDLRRIKGLGPKLVSLLGEQGITSFAQIAAWDEAEIDRVDATLGRFAGRIRRDDWVAQARLLAADDLDGYVDRFGKV